MPPKSLITAVSNPGQSKKRKEHPQSSNSKPQHSEKGRASKRAKTQNARAILTQTSDAALSNGELDVHAFLKAREFEIKALEDGMRRSKGALSTRAFQLVPRDMRRRTASHNVKRVPKRLQKRVAREMREDNTPTVTANKRKPSSARGRLRAETAKKLGLLAQKRRLARAKGAAKPGAGEKRASEAIVGRIPRPKLKKNELNQPPKCPSKFRKRQIHKTWLPTHLYHAKRAKMTEPKKPLWRMAIPLTPTQKCYRPTHRAGGARGALCWDMSYMSTVSLEGTEIALEKVLRAVGIAEDDAWGGTGTKWREGKRVWSGWLSREENGCRIQFAPATIVWCRKRQDATDNPAIEDAEMLKKSKKDQFRRLFVRIHPSAFLTLWDALLKSSKMQRPLVHVQDLRFEVGSIELTGPNSTEALLGVLHPFNQLELEEAGHMKAFKALSGVTNAAALPRNALLTLSVVDPRLHYPPRKVCIPKPGDEAAAFFQADMLAQWTIDKLLPLSDLFEQERRFKATRLASQKSINRRKGAASPGEYPSRSPTDQPIPVILYTSRTPTSAGQGTWTVLAPWKCILPIWYCLVHYPLSSGANPRFGGLQELRQIHFESGRPWFPADYPGTNAGYLWELDERQQRKAEWDKRPKGRKTQFESLDLGGGRRGEIGLGWACDFEILNSTPQATEGVSTAIDGTRCPGKDRATEVTPTIQSPFKHLTSSMFSSLLSNPKADIPTSSLVTIRVTLFSRGVPQACARIYRLPQDVDAVHLEGSSSIPDQQKADGDISTTSATLKTQSKLISTLSPSLRSQWLALAPSSSKAKVRSKAKSASMTPQGLNLSALPPGPARHRALAQSLLQDPPLSYPADLSRNSSATAASTHPLVPGMDDLIGFVTTGNFNLAEGKGTAIGSVLVGKLLGRVGERDKERKICIVRNAGEAVGRLGCWEVV